MSIDQITDLYNWRFARGHASEQYPLIAKADIEYLGGICNLHLVRACDAGCGLGEHLFAMEAAGVRWPVGIDISGEALRAVLAKDTQNGLVLIMADMKSWDVRGDFDLVLSSLPPVSMDASQNVYDLMDAFARMLRRGGTLFLKVFCRDFAGSILGRYSAQYAGSISPKHSEISLSEDGCALVIEEYYEDAPAKRRQEILALLSKDELTSALRYAGLFVRDIRCPDAPLQLPGTITIVARRD